MEKQPKNTPVCPLIGEKGRGKAPVAVFDSGAGGIAVLRELHVRLPHEDLLYFGDSANAPYGERSSEEVCELTLSHAARLLTHAKALVLACNTATAVAAHALRWRYPDVPVIGMEPALRPALATAPHPRILVMATEVTLREEKFAHLLEKCAENCTVLPLPAPDIVRLVERGEEKGVRMATYLRGLLAPFCETPPDAVVLGCTHFCFVREQIAQIVGKRVPIFDGVAGTAAQLVRRLAAADLLNGKSEQGSVTLTSSDGAALPLYARLLMDE